MTIRSTFRVGSSLAMLGIVACGGVTLDRPATLQRLRTAIDAEVTDYTVLEDHNQLAEDVGRSGVLEGMFQQDVQDALGRGADCGVSDICARRGFRPTDWVYELGHAPGDPSLPAGPTLILGFDGTGRVVQTFYLTRRAPAAAR